MSSSFPPSSAASTASLLDLDLGAGRPPVLHVATPADPQGWAANSRDALAAVLAEHGAVLVRGLGLRDVGQAAGVFRALGSELVPEQEAFAPRPAYADRVYGSTPWPPNQPMCMHHELSYRLEVPSTLLLACLSAPERGGATALADAAAVLEALPRDLVQRFERDGWLLTRTYNPEIGASLSESFGTEDPGEVEAYCRANAIEATWLPDGSLRTRQRRAAVVTAPRSGRRCWFNQVAFLNEWTLAEDVREYLVEEYGSDGLPFNTAFGNGDPIGADVVELLNSVYEAATVREPWQAGDLMLLDNIATAHSREPFEGPREVVVGLADPVRPAGADGAGADR